MVEYVIEMGKHYCSFTDAVEAQQAAWSIQFHTKDIQLFRVRDDGSRREINIKNYKNLYV